MTDQPQPGRDDGAVPGQPGPTGQYSQPQYPQYGSSDGQQYPQYPQYSPYDQQAYYQHPTQQYPSPYPQPYPQPQLYAQPQPQPYPQQYGYPYAPPPPPPRRGGTGRSLLVGVGAALAATAVVLAGVALTGNDDTDRSGIAFGPNPPTAPVQPGTPTVPAAPGNGSGSGGAGNGAAQRSGPASASQKIGVVTIVSTLKYDNALSAGTGMIMSSDGRVLTNNHVVRGSTSIQVTVDSTGRKYTATVLGTAPTSDVAVIKLSDASGLTPARFAADAGGIRVGDDIVGVGNGGGTGKLTAAAGKVTALNQSITASDENGQAAEKLTGLIQVNARIISGDSGGPLYDAGQEIVGMNTAASAQRSNSPTAYAIPIENAMDVAKQIESGVETSTIRIGYPGFLGIKTRPGAGPGAEVGDVIDGLPAQDAGIAPGSYITGVDGKTIRSGAALTKALKDKNPGDRVRIAWTAPSGLHKSADITLTKGPAD